MISLAIALSQGPVLLDGGLATQLEARGHDLSSDLWSARLLLDNPEEITAAHADYFAVGAQVAITSSYQLSYEGMAALGHDRSTTDRMLRLSVELARAAGDGYWVAASVGPYGAMLAGGEEYVGNYGLSVAELIAWHRPRIEALLAAEPDVLACETIPCRAEAEALLTLISEYAAPAWLSLTVAGGLTRNREPLDEIWNIAADVTSLVAVGVNCCASDDVADSVASATHITGKPGVAYPNSGEGWDGAARTWQGEGTFSPADVASWVNAGGRLIGGCCRVGPDDISALGAALRASA